MNHMATRTAILLVLLTVVLLPGCGAPEHPATTPEPAAAGDAAGGTRLAAGLYDLADGTVQAIGTLEWVDLEGGFWAIVGGTQASGDVGTTVAVVANAAKDDPAYVALGGQTVQVNGKRMSGASVRMAGPEIKVSSITAISDTAAANE